MTRTRVAQGVTGVVLAVLVASAGAAVNLHLMGTREPPAEQRALPASSRGAEQGSASGSADRPDAPASPSSTTVPPLTPTTAPAVSVPSTSPPATGATPATTTSHSVGPAGTVTLSVQGNVIAVISVEVGAGWTYAPDHASGADVELRFRRGADGAQAALHAQLENGRLVVEIDDSESEPADD